MVQVFKPTSGLRFTPGDFFLGVDKRGREIGIRSDRHAITFAGSRSGKGAAVIIPNLKRWPHSALVIDPKGENAEETWKDRVEMGQSVHVIDPFGKADIPDHIRASFSPLAGIDKDGLTAGSDLLVIGDGLIKKTNPEHAEWDATAAKILAGVMGFALAEAPAEMKTITAARNILLQQDEDLRDDANQMLASDEFDGVVKDAGSIILTALNSEKPLEGQALSQAKRQTQWVGMKAFRQVLESSTFNLSDLQHGRTTVYLVLPPEYLVEHGAFLKMFVQTAIDAMLKSGTKNSGRCLFFLDEFYGLGRMDSIMKGFGLMAGYGVQIWPILQDLGQLWTTYGKEGLATFFGNSDLHQFFGTTDDLTLDHVSTRLGVVGVDEIDLPYAPTAPMMTGVSVGRGVSSLGAFSKNTHTRGALGIMGGLMSAGEGAISAARQAAFQDEMAAYQQDMQMAMAQAGRPRMPSDEVGQLIQRPTGGGIAKAMICFVAGHGAISLRLAPYFGEPTKSVLPTGDASTHGISNRLGMAIITFLINLATWVPQYDDLPELWTYWHWLLIDEGWYGENEWPWRIITIAALMVLPTLAIVLRNRDRSLFMTVFIASIIPPLWVAGAILGIMPN